MGPETDKPHESVNSSNVMQRRTGLQQLFSLL